jgi:hypothetical protein
MSELNRQMTYLQLVRECLRIEIPLIQRDYAQGRNSESSVRDAFLDTLYDKLTLPPNDPSLPLNLDFIYGSVEDATNSSSCFLPLDGQQRLTTLHLIHWYAAWKDDALDDYRIRLTKGNKSRFSYTVRPSSTEFFEALLHSPPAGKPEEKSSPRKLIEDQPWFYLYWRLDPTIQAALDMLDAVHSKFSAVDALYNRLTDEEYPAITFQLLQLKDFGLSDELYIKMNARGKPLTPFETFKARYEDHLKEQFGEERLPDDTDGWSVSQFFAHRMDGRWTDLFWSYRSTLNKKLGVVFDHKVMNLLWAVARVCLSTQSPAFIEHTKLLSNKALSVDYDGFKRRGWLTKNFAYKLIYLLEAWSGGDEKLRPVLSSTRYFDEAAFFKKATDSPDSFSYAELIQFSAFISYLRHHHGKVQSEEFQNWMRVVFNLSTNSEFRDPSEFQRALRGIRIMLPSANEIIKYLSALKLIPALGFSHQQIREEKLKANLILGHLGWRDRIDRAEGHGYFKGQIEFLLDFCGAMVRPDQLQIGEWNDATHEEVQRRFDDYLEKAKLMFNNSGLKIQGRYLWQRALLATGDYLLDTGKNFSLLTDNPDYRDSWRRYLQLVPTDKSPLRHYIRKLWDQLKTSELLSSQLQRIIDEAGDVEEWRRVILHHPDVIAYCDLCEIRWEGNPEKIYLLKTTQMNGAHAELFTYALWLDMRDEGWADDLIPLKMCDYYFPISKANEPHIRLSYSVGDTRVLFEIHSGGFGFQIIVRQSQLIDLPNVSSTLVSDADFTELPTVLRRNCARDAIREALMSIASLLKTVA